LYHACDNFVYQIPHSTMSLCMCKKYAYLESIPALVIQKLAFIMYEFDIVYKIISAEI